MFPSGVKFLIGVFPDLFGTVAGRALQDLAIKWVRSSVLVHQQTLWLIFSADPPAANFCCPLT